MTARDPATREQHRRYERDRRLAVQVAEERPIHDPRLYLVQWSTPYGILATCHRDLAVVFADLIGAEGRIVGRTRSRVRDRVRRDTAN